MDLALITLPDRLVEMAGQNATAWVAVGQRVT
jgi:hypothetical protein